MLPLPRGAVWQTLFLLCAVLFINEVRSEGRVVCYYTNWSVYRPGTAKFNPQNINPYLCTHLVYAFGGFTKDNQMKPFDKYQDIEQGGYAKFTGLKTYNKQLKTMIAIGGWNEASSRFSPLVASSERRQQFIKNILKFLRQNHFDGIDLDWEYPAHRAGGKPRDRDNYAQFVQELRAEFERESKKTGRPRLLLTMAVPAGIEHIDRGYDIPKLNKYLDWFNLLSYDFHSSHESSANHHAPLYSMEEESEYNYDTELNTDFSVKYYLKAGADRDKLVLGIPTYGRSYTLINEESTELGAPSEGPGEQGDATREKGYLAYYEICQNIKDDPEWTVVQPNPNAMGPYAFRRNQWVGYDDEDIVRKKAQYVVEHGLGGIMFWAIDNDDFRGTCTGKPYPLIEAAKEAMLEGLGLGINEVSKPSSQKKPLRSRSRENSSSTRNRIGADEIVKTDQKRIQVTTTTAPSTTIKLTEAEGSSLYIGGRTTTPPPPTTPDPGADFKCEEEGFFQHPRDCKKYFWCLDSGPSGLGIVAHQFTCPSGLYFNPSADSCDFARNVPCKIKKLTTPTPAISTTTTPRTTTASNRITAATSRNSFLRTTATRRPTTTTTTAAAPEEEEEEIEYVDEDETPTQIKDKDAEEDPKVIKELIELIRKVGGIEELEKHLQRKEDGSILLKEETSSVGVPTTQSTISKTLYDKVLSRPNTYNSFRNRLIKNAEQTKTAEITETVAEAQDEGRSSNSNSGGSNYSKYSSVVRSGNGRQGPQNAGIEKLPEFEGLLKEKKQYVTINRNRGASTHSQNDEEEADEEDAEKNEETLKEEAEKKGVATSTPAYTTIRRSRPTTVKTDTDEESQKEINEMRNYATLNRYRGRLTTTPEPGAEVEDVVSTTKRYKYQERTRPTKFTTAFKNSEQLDDDDDDTEDENDGDGETEEDHENVMSHLTDDNDSSTQKSQTTRTYASIGRRKTTTTPATPTETPTTRTTTKTNQFDTTTSNGPTTPEPISTTTTISQKTRTHTPTNTSELITTSIDSIPITSTSTISSLSTTTVISSTSTPVSGDNSDSLYDSTTLPPAVSSLSSVDTSEETHSDLSHSLNSLVQETASPTTESTGLDTTKQDNRNDLITTTAKTTTKTLTTTGTTDTDSHEGDDKVTTTNLNKHLTKPQYKFTTKTRNITTTTTNNSDNATNTKTTTTTRKENSNSDNDIDIANDNDNDQTSLNNESNQSNSSGNSLSSNSVYRGNSVKYTGGRRQQQQQTELPFNRKSQIPTQQTYRTKSTTSRTTAIATDEFLGTVSSPRPFGFPKRRGRPTKVAATVNETSSATSAIDRATNKKVSLSSENATSSQAEHVSVKGNRNIAQNQYRNQGSTTSTQTQTHDVETLVDGRSSVSSNGSSSGEVIFKHVLVNSNVLSKNEDDESAQEKKRLYSWRDPRDPTKRPLKWRKVKSTDETATRTHTNRVREGAREQNVLESAKNKGDDQLLSHTSARAGGGKYRGKSLESDTNSTGVQEQSSGNLNISKYSRRRLKMVTDDTEDKTNDIFKSVGTESTEKPEAEHETESKAGQTRSKTTVAEEVTRAGNDLISKTDTQEPESSASKSPAAKDINDLVLKYKLLAGQEHFDSGEIPKREKSYQTASRPTSFHSTGDAIGYKSIVRSDHGTQLSDVQASGFAKNTDINENTENKAYHSISGGGKLPTESADKTTSSEINNKLSTETIDKTTSSEDVEKIPMKTTDKITSVETVDTTNGEKLATTKAASKESHLLELSTQFRGTEPESLIKHTDSLVKNDIPLKARELESTDKNSVAALEVTNQTKSAELTAEVEVFDASEQTKISTAKTLDENSAAEIIDDDEKPTTSRITYHNNQFTKTAKPLAIETTDSSVAFDASTAESLEADLTAEISVNDEDISSTIVPETTTTAKNMEISTEEPKTSRHTYHNKHRNTANLEKTASSNENVTDSNLAGANLSVETSKNGSGEKSATAIPETTTEGSYKNHLANQNTLTATQNRKTVRRIYHKNLMDATTEASNENATEAALDESLEANISAETSANVDDEDSTTIIPETTTRRSFKNRNTTTKNVESTTGKPGATARTYHNNPEPSVKPKKVVATSFLNEAATETAFAESLEADISAETSAIDDNELLATIVPETITRRSFKSRNTITKNVESTTEKLKTTARTYHRKTETTEKLKKVQTTSFLNEAATETAFAESLEADISAETSRNDDSEEPTTIVPETTTRRAYQNRYTTVKTPDYDLDATTPTTDIENGTTDLSIETTEELKPTDSKETESSTTQVPNETTRRAFLKRFTITPKSTASTTEKPLVEITTRKIDFPKRFKTTSTSLDETKHDNEAVGIETTTDAEANRKEVSAETLVDHKETTTNGRRKVIQRGTYRPHEEGDISSLLALDVSKLQNQSQNSAVAGRRRRPVVKAAAALETEEKNVELTKDSAESAEEQLKASSLNVTSASVENNTNTNGRVRKVFRKRIFSSRKTELAADGNENNTAINAAEKTAIETNEIEPAQNSTVGNVLNASNGTTENDISKLNNDISSENSNELSKTSKFSARNRFSSRSNRKPQTTTTESETVDDGVTKIRTTHTETFNTGSNTQKTIKRTGTKTVKQENEYEYVYDVVTEQVPTTTRRAITRNRGSAKFQSNDLSSLLALDYSTKSNRKSEGGKTIVKTRRRLVQRPKITENETEDIEEYETETATRPARPATVSTTHTATARRTRPTRPARTTTTTTAANEIDSAESTTSTSSPITTRKGYQFRRPTIKSTTPAPQVEEIVTTTLVSPSSSQQPTARKKYIPKKGSLNTGNESIENETTVEEHIKSTITNNFIGGSKLNKSVTSSTELPTTDAVEHRDAVQEHVKNTLKNNYIGGFKLNKAVTSSTESPTTGAVEHHDTVDVLRNQFQNAINLLKETTESPETTTVSNEVEDPETKSTANLQKELNGSEESLSLPIYHRRKYYKYYKDSPIIYVGENIVQSQQTSPSNVDIKKQIHEVFNVSEDNLVETALSAETEAKLALDQAMEINQELDHFLLKTPGSV